MVVLEEVVIYKEPRLVILTGFLSHSYDDRELLGSTHAVRGASEKEKSRLGILRDVVVDRRGPKVGEHGR